MRTSNSKHAATCAGFAAVIAFLAFTLPVWAAPPVAAPSAATPPAATQPVATAPIFPPGSHIGLVPPPGMVPSKTFPGFVDPTNTDVGMVIGSLPIGAYDDILKSLTPDALKKQGITLEKRETIQLNVGQGLLVTCTQVFPDKKPYRKWLLFVPMQEFAIAITMQAPISASAYSDAVVRAALATIVARPKVPLSEYLSLLPFTVGDFAGFQTANVIPGRALLLIDAPAYPHMVTTQGLPEYEFDARSIVTAVPSAPSSPEGRLNFARLAFGSIAGIKDVQMTMSEPVRIDDQEGFETVARAKDAANGANLMVVQWLRFSGTRSLQIVGISRAEIWDRELSRLRAIRDSVAFR